MKENFEVFFNNISKEKITDQWNLALEEKKKLRNISLILIIPVDIFLLFSFISISASNLQSYIFALIVCLLIDAGICMIVSLFGTKNIKRYNEIFKTEIVEKILNNFFDDVDYVPLKSMPQAIYKEGMYEPYDIYDSDDYLEAKIDSKYPIKMAEVLTQEETTTTDSEGNTTTTTTTLFNGVFAKIDLQKSIKNELKIRINNSISKRKRLEMDSSEFEKYFDVSSTDKIIGMQLLTHDIMEILVNYRKDQGKPFDILIRDNIMYIRFHIGSIFETKVNKNSPVDKDTVEKYFKIVKFIYVLSKQMINVVNETQI